MKIIKFIIITSILVIITNIIPLFLFNITSNTDSILKPVDDTNLSGPLGYAMKISSSPDATQEIKSDAMEIITLSTQLLEYKTSTYNNLLLYLMAVVDISLITMGFILLKCTNHKLIANCFITAGIISIVIFAVLFVIIFMNVII